MLTCHTLCPFNITSEKGVLFFKFKDLKFTVVHTVLYIKMDGLILMVPVYAIRLNYQSNEFAAQPVFVSAYSSNNFKTVD
jgi:hypothetical protein